MKSMIQAITVNQIQDIKQLRLQDIEQSYINKKRIAKAENNMTKEEIEIVNLTAAGYTQKEIAKKLNKKPKDIDNILARIRKNNKEN